MNQRNPEHQLTIGVVSTPGDPQLGTIINGVVETFRQCGGRVIVVTAPIAEVGVPLPASAHVDGWIVVHWQAGLRELVATGAPIVTVNLAVEGVDCPAVLPDNAAGTYALISHLARLGHRRIAFLGDMQHQDVRDRYAGYARALSDSGLALDPALVLAVDSPDDTIVCRNAFQKISAGGLACSAIFAGHDYNAQRLIREAKRAGLRVPEDLAVVGFDDIETAQYCAPPLTTVRQQFVEHGRVAAHLLLSLIAGEPIPERVIMVPTALVVRQSCGSAGAEEHVVESAGRAATWEADLGRALVRELRHPLPPDPAMTPDQIWPGVSRIAQILAETRDARPTLTSESLDPVWREACQLSPPLANVLSILERIEQTTLELGAASTDPAAPARLHALLRAMRLRLLWHHQVYGSNAGSDTAHVAEVYQWAVTTLLDPTHDAERLGWVEHTNDAWACFGRWGGDQRPADGQLEVIGAFARDPGLVEAARGRVDVASFPALEGLPESFQSGEHILKILPVRTAGSYWGLLALCGPIEPRQYSPALAQILGTVLDTRALQTERAQQQETLRHAYERERALAETVRELGSPVIPIMRGVLLVPLVGAIDGERSQQIIERVLHAVSTAQATTVLLDLTGVPLVDTQVASALVQTARATTMLGAEALMVGIRPEIAQSIIGLGIDLSAVRSFSSLAVALESLRRSRNV